jgi:hypothetical protein
MSISRQLSVNVHASRGALVAALAEAAFLQKLSHYLDNPWLQGVLDFLIVDLTLFLFTFAILLYQAILVVMYWFLLKNIELMSLLLELYTDVYKVKDCCQDMCNVAMP